MALGTPFFYFYFSWFDFNLQAPFVASLIQTMFNLRASFSNLNERIQRGPSTDFNLPAPCVGVK